MKKQTKALKPLKANGRLPVKLGWSGAYHKFEITAGPFDAFVQRDDDDFGVCVRAERVPAGFAGLNLPIHDFEVPAVPKAQVEYVIRRTLQAAMDGKRVYVGCMGGWGRTGLFLALLAKVCGEDDPVAYVRLKYNARAVETEKQAAYIRDFDVTALRHWLFWSGWSARFMPGMGTKLWGSPIWWLH